MGYRSNLLKKRELEEVGSSLHFDNINFKLAVLQQLIFEKKLFSPEYDFGDFYEMAYDDDADYEEEYEKYCARALQYFTYLSVPSEYAESITRIDASIDDDIYYEICPEWDGDDRFYINEISEREAIQFPKLRDITFWYMSDCVEELKKQLKPLKIKVNTARPNGEKTVSLWSSAALLLLPAILCGLLAGLFFAQRYGDIEVTVSNEPLEENTLASGGEEESSTADDADQEKQMRSYLVYRQK